MMESIGELAMRDKAQTRNVSLDTEVFRGQGHNFSSPLLKTLIRLAVDDFVQLLLTSVTEKEVRKQLGELANAEFKQLKEFRRACRFARSLLPSALDSLDKLDKEAMRKAAHAEFDAFLKAAKITALPIEGVSPDLIWV